MASLAWNLRRPRFFEKFVVEGLDENTEEQSTNQLPKYQNLAHIVDDILYFWKSSTQTIIKINCSDLLHSSEIEPLYSEWSLNPPLTFRITHISVRNTTKEAVLVWGPTGAAIITFPRCSKKDVPSKKFVATCTVLDEITYVEYSELRILQAKWHPTKSQNVVFILNNDNHIRSYDLEAPLNACSVTSVGVKNAIPLRFYRNPKSEFTLSFDFGPHLTVSGYWSIFFLKNSGSISYLLMKFIGHTVRSLWENEKVIPVDETETVFDQPTIMSVGKSYPLLITIGGTGGSIYHSVLLPMETENDLAPLDTPLSLEDNLITGEMILFLKETIIVESEKQLNRLQFVPDPLCSHRYAFIHEDGIQLISINFIPRMNELLLGSFQKEHGRDSDTGESGSTCRHILACKGRNPKDEFGGTYPTLPGVCFSDSVPQIFLVITQKGEVLIYDIPKPYSINLPNLEVTGSAELSLNPIAINALENVRFILARTSSQPYIVPTGPGLSPDKKEAQMIEYIRTLQREYIQKQEQAMKFLSSALEYLYERARELQSPLKMLQLSLPSVRAKAEELAEKYEEQNDIQNQLYKRFQAVVSRHHRGRAVLSDEERKWDRKFYEFKLGVQNMREMVDGLQTAHNLQTLRQDAIKAEDGKTSSPIIAKVATPDLLKSKKQIIEHQRLLTELNQSIHDISRNIPYESIPKSTSITMDMDED